MIRQIRNYIENNDFKIVVLNNKVNVVNYKDIIKISTQLISLDSGTDIVNIKGDNLVLGKLLDNEILIVGKISSIEVKAY